jgi:hypothetical protein
MSEPNDDPRLVRVEALCMALPEVAREAMGQHARFVVRGKSFVYFLNDHHGDGRVGLCCKVAAGLNAMMAADDPGHYYIPAYLGANGWVGLRLDQGEIDWDEVTALIHDSYRLIAPKRLAAQVAPSSEPAD